MKKVNEINKSQNIISKYKIYDYICKDLLKNDKIDYFILKDGCI